MLGRSGPFQLGVANGGHIEIIFENDLNHMKKTRWSEFQDRRVPERSRKALGRSKLDMCMQSIARWPANVSLAC